MGCEVEKKNKFYCHKSPVPLRDVEIEKVLVSNKISFGKKTTNILLITCIKLSHYIKCFLKQALMQKVMVDKLNGCILWLKMITYWKVMILFGIK